MKILITNNHLELLGGSETFTYALAQAMRRKGRHEVHVFAFTHGRTSERMPELMVDKPDDSYDLILVNHNTCLTHLMARGTKGYKIFTSHGTVPKLEQPAGGADAYVAISEEVQHHLREKGYESVVINNGVDTERFRPRTPINDTLKRVLCLCKEKDAIHTVEAACERVGATCERSVGNWSVEDKMNESVGNWSVEDKMNEVDAVVSLGRGALEAMACGRAVYIYDQRRYTGIRGADGWVTEWNYEELAKFNFSGRRYHMPVSDEAMAQDFLAGYTKEMGDKNRKLAFTKFNIDVQADKYINLMHL